VVLCYYLRSYEKSCLLILWCIDDRCDMTNNNEDHDMSKRPGTED
jgi:hypothetical protein